VTTNQVLIGVGLILALAAGSQVLASRLRIPAIIVLLPAGFVAGALTTDVNPQRLLGPAFEPLVSLSVAVILYDAGLSLDMRKLQGHTRKVVSRLIVLGVLITWVLTASVAAPLLGMSRGAAVMLGIILVVSGPTVVGPLLNFVRPKERLQQVLIWEGSLIDPVGGILGALVFHGVVASTRKGPGSQFLQFAASVGIGLAGGVIGAALLWLLLRKLRLGEVLGTTAQLATVIAVAAACDVIREDAGLLAAIFMGLALANRRGFDVPARRPFFETLVQLIIGVLFISISATVTPQSLRHLILPTLALIAVLVLVARPAAAFASTLKTDLAAGERAFIGWMAPRGIVAAATASTFAAGLAAKGVGGAAKILPVTFVVIVVTVTLYGLTAMPAARRLGVTRPARTRPLLVGGAAWVIELGQALQSAGLEVLMWAGLDHQRKQIERAELELAPGELVAAATGRGARLEGITAVRRQEAEDQRNTHASVLLAECVDGHVYRLAPPRRSHGVVAPYTAGEILFGQAMTRPAITGRYQGGARIVTSSAGGALPAGQELLFLVRADGQLAAVTQTDTPTPLPGDTIVSLAPAPAPPADRDRPGLPEASDDELSPTPDRPA
jgi:NhaP-type Na+/H+ or K+/H+ antiporter